MRRKLLMILTIPLLFVGSAFGAVNINTATQDELQTLSGITATKAKAIIDYRSKAGKFKATEDLAKVDGVNEQHLDMKQLYREVTVTGPTVLKLKEKTGSQVTGSQLQVLNALESGALIPYMSLI